MCKIISVSNRQLAVDFENRIKEILDLGITVILREKDLTADEYFALAKKVISFGGDVILHSFADEAKKLGHKKIHLPMPIFENTDISGFEVVGVSVHSAEEAIRAQNLGASYVIAGHIFGTDCKKGIQPRGLGYLKEICQSVQIPVYAIGGITPDNFNSVIKADASGVCIMSGLMKCENPEEFIRNFKKGLF